MKIKQAALTATYTLYTIYTYIYTRIYCIYSFIFIEECRENMAQIKCQQAEMKLQLVGHADDAKSRRVDAERGGGNPFYPGSPCWRDSFIESLHFTHAVSTVLPFLATTPAFPFPFPLGFYFAPSRMQ